MHAGHRQVIAEKIASTVRVLELLGLPYEVGPPKNQRRKGNKSPRVVTAHLRNGQLIRIYNSASGHTWANQEDGTPIRRVNSPESLYQILQDLKKPSKRR